ncbi:iron ABC transporter permease [Deinococcus sp. SDU3-2]|uniref:Iron ABC transporter permease n=1 Tax=Deinococcus terrestris TaxID=2651870 RepID=A0A7X1NXG1_9DEIO|nr:iron ABC transporter permease [Deinococcus terrestris]MPY67612.1 iron ABC transporter permease [Deinococcus terrestris]
MLNRSVAVSPTAAGRSPGTFVLWLAGAFAVLLAALVLAVTRGSVPVSPAQIVEVLRGGGDDLARTVILDLRLPRALLAAVVGGNLAVAGVLLQSALRNPLGDPHLVGVSAGAGLGAVLAFSFFAGSFAALPLSAFAGALLSAVIVYGLAYREGAQPLRLILAGVALTSLLGAATNALLSVSSAPLPVVMSWLMGGFSGRSWGELEALLPWSVVGLIAALVASRAMNVLALGDELAHGLGLRVERLRLGLLALGAMLAGASVAASGVIGFVGLVVPHVARLTVGAAHERVVPLSWLLGAALLVVADTAARLLLDPTELPVGIFTAALGAPYFLHLLRRRV